MRANTIYQPWATLIVVGAKPYEFRDKSFLNKQSYRNGPSIGERIAIHASARPMKLIEIEDIRDRLEHGESALKWTEALMVLNIIAAAEDPKRALPLGYVLGTAVLGKPELAVDLFRDKVADSSRLNHSIWAWPLTDIVRFEEPVRHGGMQGFWQFPDNLVPR